MKLLFAIIFSSLLFSPAKVTEWWVIEKSSNLCITGRSNIAPFQCDVVEYLKEDTIVLESHEGSPLLGIKGGVEIDINRIDCHQRQLTNNLRKTLKADKNPILKISLVSIGNFRIEGRKNVQGSVIIDLAGVSRKMQIDYEVETDADNNIHLVGIRQLLFSDFKLKAPNKLAGLVKVDDKLQIRFMLVLRAIQK
ncbi:MAG: YceI family protein [Verrucomicrobia bacterium]|nr:YceI family protein [Prolixibacteraceae bacterium]